MRDLIIGLVFTLIVGARMHYGQIWEAGSGKVPKVIVAEYMDMAYNKGEGKKANDLYFAKDAEDNVVNPIDRQDGPPIAHEIQNITGSGMDVVVHQKIAANRGQNAVEVIDYYTIKKARIKSRNRIVRQVAEQ